MSARILCPAVCLVLSASTVGCGCHDTGIEGDTDIDPGPWDPPIENLGEPGWRDSTEPWCDELMGENPRHYGYDVWSDAEAVFVLLYEGVCLSDGDCIELSRVYRNGGTDWTLYMEDVYGDEPGEDPLVLTRIVGLPNTHGILFGIADGLVRIINRIY